MRNNRYLGPGVFLSLWLLGGLQAQDLRYVRTVVDTLSSPAFHGRGYVLGGDSLAAGYIRDQFASIGLNPINPGYFQSFKHDVNTFPGAMDVSLDNQRLKPGVDFLVDPASTGTYGTFELHWLNDLLKIPAHKLGKYLDKTGDFNFIVIEEGDVKPEERMQLFVAAQKTFNARGVILATKKLTWSVSSFSSDLLVIEILNTRINRKVKKISLNIENRSVENYSSSNVIGYKDNGRPDSVIVFTAHYDHLGRMGTKTYFPGANDNASGVAMLLDLARFYAKDSMKYNVAFIAFAGEEAGLAGSKFYTENPAFPLKNIRFLVNLDLMGNGEDGITVVNGTLFEKEFGILALLNEEQDWVPVVKKRGKARNSDHYYFTENDVPAFFIYTLGGNKAYHDLNDMSKTLEMRKYNEVFKLITGFISAL